MKRILLIWIIAILLGSFILAVDEQVTTWSTGSTIENLTFDEVANQSLYIDIPKYGYVNGASLIITSPKNRVFYYPQPRYGYWTFNETYNSTLGETNTTYFNTQFNTSDFVGGNSSVTFMGTSYIALANVSNPLGGSTENLYLGDNFTIGFWMKGECTPLLQRHWSGQASRFDFGCSSNKIKYTRDGGTFSLTGTTDINPGEWNHYLMRINDSKLYIYLNGKLENEGNEATDFFSTRWIPLRLNCIGAAPCQSNLGFDGQVDELGVWNNTGLNDNQILSLANYTVKGINVYMENQLQYNSTTRVEEATQININTTQINNLLSEGCSFSDYDCRLNLSFSSQDIGELQVNVSNSFNYSYGLDTCTNSFNIPSNATALFIDFEDEDNGTKLTGITDSTFIYDIGGDSTTFTNTSNSKNLSICIYPNWATIESNVSIKYSANEYPERRYSVNNAQYNNITQDLTLLLLYSADGIYVRFRTEDTYSNVIPGVQGQMRLSGENEVVESETTDSSGLATFFVNPDQDYDFTFSKSGYTTNTFTLRPTSSEIYTVTMGAEGVGEEVSLSTGISYDFNPKIHPLANDTSYDFNFDLESTYWTILGCGLYLYNASTVIASSTGYNASACTISINFNTGSYTTINGEAIVNVNGTNVTYPYSWAIYPSYVGQFSLKNFIDDVTAFTDAGFDAKNKMLIAFIFTLVIVGGLKFKTTINVEAQILLVWALTAFFSWANWMRLEWVNFPPTFSTFLTQWFIFVLVSLITLGMIIRRNA